MYLAKKTLNASVFEVQSVWEMVENAWRKRNRGGTDVSGHF